MMTYDPAFMNTAACRSAITFIDGDKGILEYRGYPIEQLAEKSTYLETAWLLLHGELPAKAELEAWKHTITYHTFINENLKGVLDSFRYNAHPMGMLIAMISALGTFYPEAKNIFDEDVRKRQIERLIAKMITIAGFGYRHMVGMPYVYPDNDLSYPANFLNMMYKTTELKYEPDPALVHALDVLFILHADHEQNCSTSTMRVVGSSHVDPYSAVAAACAALYGPLHGGANEQVIRMLTEIGSKQNIAGFIEKVKKGEGVKLMGFGHRVYKNYDPRAAIVKKVARDVLDSLDKRDPLLDLAMQLEEAALADEYFVERKLYPNVDFYTGVIYKAMGFPTRMFTVLFAIGRLPGWIAQWREMIEDPATKIGRPRQVYVGEPERDVVPIAAREAAASSAS